MGSSNHDIRAKLKYKASKSFVSVLEYKRKNCGAEEQKFQNGDEGPG